MRYQGQFRLVVWGVLAEDEEQFLNPFSIMGEEGPSVIWKAGRGWSVILSPVCRYLYSSCSVSSIAAGHSRVRKEQEAWVSPPRSSSSPVPMFASSAQVLDDPAEDNLYLGE